MKKIETKQGEYSKDPFNYFIQMEFEYRLYLYRKFYGVKKND